jgi:hypothetical protein
MYLQKLIIKKTGGGWGEFTKKRLLMLGLSDRGTDRGGPVQEGPEAGRRVEETANGRVGEEERTGSQKGKVHSKLTVISSNRG